VHLVHSKIVAILHHQGQQFFTDVCPGLSTRRNKHIMPEEVGNVDPDPSVGNNMRRY
jgi:hypothetical protein